MKKKTVIIVLLIAGMLLLGYGFKELINLAIIDYKSDNPSNPILNITSIVTCLIASLSLLASLFFGYKNFRDRLKEKQQDTEYYWYKALVVDKLLPVIFDFFNKCKNDYIERLERVNERNVKNNLKHNEYTNQLKKEFIEPFTSQFISTQEEIVIESAIISDELSIKLKEDFEAFQDDFLNYSVVSNPDYKKMKTDVVEAQKKVVCLIKQHNEKIYK